jgi:hypothetical protein
MKHAKIPVFGKHGMGKFMLIDLEDVEKVTNVRWFVSWNGYATNRSKVNGNNTNLRAHRVIMNAPKGMDVDHINHDKLDNRKVNLRVCTRSENLFNKLNVKGYYFDKKRNRWVVDYKFIGVGWKQFKTEKEAKEFVKNELGTISRRTK